ncbi:MAG: hypothetical protein Q7R97_02155 [Candidatus Daviesbacteria bacterium]|nr:hypothetical protein [Candidatus Daviesbacteria bacterium]
MDQPKTVGIINIINGIVFATIPSIMLFFVAPKLVRLYQQESIPISNFNFGYFFIYLTIFVCLASILYGILLLFMKRANKLATKCGGILAVADGLFGLSAIVLCIPTFILPIYTLSNSIK